MYQSFKLMLWLNGCRSSYKIRNIVRFSVLLMRSI
jgi:hypothetical protein